jgi:hypothetical protein
MRVSEAIAILVVAHGLVGCGPGAPSPIPVSQAAPQPASIQLTGFVFDTANRALPGARVDVLTGPQAGTSTFADAHGAFALTGGFDDTTRFRASKEDYISATQTFTSVATRKTIFFALAGVGASAQLAGDYTVTFIADSACPDFPNQLRTRTYAATIAPVDFARPADTYFVAALSGASLDTYYNRLIIFVAGNYVLFDLSDNYLLEEVGDEAYLTIGGTGSTSVATSGVSTISVPFDGLFDYCAMKSEREAGSGYNGCVPGETVAHAQCVSKNHRLILTRR